MVHDLLPMKSPQFFPSGETGARHELWLNAIGEIAESLICISQTVASDVEVWIEQKRPELAERVVVTSLHLGADLPIRRDPSALPLEAYKLLHEVVDCVNFVMVGTIEPRKGYLQALLAFELLWGRGVDVNLIIVGKEGWKGLPDESRRTIPEIVQRLQHHPEKGKRLFWLEGISDEFLEEVYKTATCLVYASEGEGFGLPLIEAAQHGTPILARDLPVFREVAGEHAFYFDGLGPEDLAKAIQEWLVLYKEERHPKSEGMTWMSWKENVEKLKEIIL
jgi:glycosyltransferase involved in cell wall biosynthesis